MDILDYTGEDFQAIKSFEGWRIGIINYSARFANPHIRERHFETDECHVLLNGKATLFEDDIAVDMEPGKVYSTPKGVWHHLVLSPDARVLVVENSNTSKENSERIHTV